MLRSVSRRFVRCVARCGRLVGRRKRGVRIGSGSGKRSLGVFQARTRLPGLGCHRRLDARWFRQAGGMPPISLGPVSGRYLSFAEWEEIAIFHAQGVGVREIARRLGRFASTISCELRRNAATRSGGLEYRATTAQWHAQRRASRPKVAKLAANDALRHYVADRLGGMIARPDGELIGGGQRRGVPSRSRTGSGSTSPTMSPCESLTRRSTRRFMCKAEVRSNAS